MNWQEKTEVKKGNIGEQLVSECLEAGGYVVYNPYTEGSHNIDIIAHASDKKSLICCEVKTKKRMMYYAETGFNLCHYEGYLQMKKIHNIDTYVAFVDEFERCIYGNWLNNLGEGRILSEGKDKVIVFKLKNMIKIKDLTEEDIKKLKEYTKENDNYDYSNVKKHFD
jgi:hypothetical protein